MEQESYRICIIVPPGYKHSACFTEVAFLLKNSFISLDYACDISLNELSLDRTNILLGYHLFSFSDDLKKYRYIPFQFEQLDESAKIFNQNTLLLLRNARAVWDYSMENIAFLRNRSINASYLPLGYHCSLEQIKHKQTKDIDLLFYGSVGGRREALLKQLSELPGISTQVLFGQYGKQRDEFIARAKIVLNIHYYSMKIFENVRVSYLLNNRCFVLSEASPVYSYTGVNLAFEEYDRIVETCQKLLQNPQDLVFRADRSYQQFKQLYPMPELLKNIL